MRVPNIFVIVLVGSLTSGTCAAQVSDPPARRALSFLVSYQPKVDWNPATVLKADFDHDGKDDFAFSGMQDGQFIIGIIHNSPRGNPKYWVLRFSVVSPSRRINQICSLNAKIETRSPVFVGNKKRMWQIPKNSRGIYLDDGCNPIDISWDQDKREFDMLRIHIML
ncbi:MAG: hypothetical protein QOE77_1999 [Blastocatellia bacterium]|jgi:hypothetical protein|nr:hypothetical protein [Blastocatellia bacterium]